MLKKYFLYLQKLKRIDKYLYSEIRNVNSFNRVYKKKHHAGFKFVLRHNHLKPNAIVGTYGKGK